jgi:hypothetical protein
MTSAIFTCRLAPAAVAALILLSACGGGGGSGGAAATTGFTPAATAPATSSTAPDPIPSDPWSLQNVCANPRFGKAPDGTVYQDRQGTLLDEMKFLRGWTDQTYLWYNEIPSTIRMADYKSAIDYFKVLKTPALTAAGQPKDRFHFTYSTDEWNALNNEGKEVGYGVTWSSGGTSGAPRTWIAAVVEPGTPAAVAGIARGDLLTAVDGVDFINTADAAGINKLNAGLYPAAAGEFHTLTVRRGTTTLTLNLMASVVINDPVKNVKVIDEGNGKVGYLSFEDHNAVSEKRLMDSFAQLKSAGVSDLVLDMRYNGGGLLYVASELAYMIAGPDVGGKTFETLVYNDKTAPSAPIPFSSAAYGFAAPFPAPRGQALPSLGLKRVTILTSGDTCSASEAVINGLRGVDVQVNLVGGTTCGKPYGFTPVDNCGTTYFTIQFKGANAKGFGDFADGFAPTCNVADDFAHGLGDPNEKMLSAALGYRKTNACPVSSGAGASAAPMQLVRPEAKAVAILGKPH